MKNKVILNFVLDILYKNVHSFTSFYFRRKKGKAGFLLREIIGIIVILGPFTAHDSSGSSRWALENYWGVLPIPVVSTSG